MNIRLKLVLSAAALAAGCVLLAGCGGSASSASSSASSGAASQSASEPAASVSAEENGASDAVASAVDALLKADPISNQFEITAMNIEYDFGAYTPSPRGCFPRLPLFPYQPDAGNIFRHPRAAGLFPAHLPRE